MLDSKTHILKTFGQRLRALRGYASLSRAHIEKHYGIPEPTIKSWEFSRNKDITQKSINRLLAMFEEAGLPCTEEWLILGKGPSPFESFMAQGKPRPMTEPPEALERAYFESLNPNSLTHTLETNTLAPHLEAGQILGGILVEREKLSKKLGHFFLFILPPQTLVVGRLTQGTKKDSFSIIQDLSLESKDAVLTDAPFTKAYEVVWWRKSTPSEQ